MRTAPMVPLFAETDPATIYTVTVAGITTLGMVATAIIGYLTGRDRRRHSIEHLKLKQQVVTLEGKVADCEADRDELKRDRDELKKRVEQLERRATRAEALADIGPAEDSDLDLDGTIDLD